MPRRFNFIIIAKSILAKNHSVNLFRSLGNRMSCTANALFVSPDWNDTMGINSHFNSKIANSRNQYASIVIFFRFVARPIEAAVCLYRYSDCVCLSICRGHVPLSGIIKSHFVEKCGLDSDLENKWTNDIRVPIDTWNLSNCWPKSQLPSFVISAVSMTYTTEIE